MTRPKPIAAACLVLLGGLCGLAPGAAAAASDARELMAASERRLRAGDESARYRMEMIDGGETVHVRELVRLEKRNDERTLTVVRFVAPAAVRNVALLIEDKGLSFNDIWTYTPATRSLRRVAGSQKRNWFMGTEFTYEDFEGYKLASYAFEQREDLVPCLRWPRCRVVDAVAAAPDEIGASGYSKKRYFLESASLFPVLIEYVGRDGAISKRLETEGLRRHGDFRRPTAQVMYSLDSRRATRLSTLQVDIGTVLDPNLFTPKALRFEEN